MQVKNRHSILKHSIEGQFLSSLCYDLIKYLFVCGIYTQYLLRFHIHREAVKSYPQCLLLALVWTWCGDVPHHVEGTWTTTLEPSRLIWGA